MSQHQNIFVAKGPIIGSFAFLLLTTLAFLREQWMIVVVPVILVIFLYAFFKPAYLFFLIVALTPLSINLEEIGRGNIAFYLPTEPLLFGFMLVILLAHMSNRIIPREVIRHPVSIAIGLYLIWVLITSFTSVHPVVSLKYLVTRLWFIVPVFFVGANLFLDHKNIPRFLLIYLIPFIGVVIYTTIRHAGNGFEEDPAHWVMEPFFRDHTQYGAIAAFFIPIAFGFITRTKQKVEARMAGIVALAFLFITLISTYSRAALLSVIAAFVIWLIVKSRVSLKLVTGTTIALALVLYVVLDDILIQLQKNNTDSSENLIENVESITNITTDASNLERINRWNSVFAMAKEKPFFGFGPGTYMFEYAPYQRSGDLTIISTNFGDVGNAHSEYLGPLAETGYPGFLTVIILLFTVFYSAYRTYRRLPDGMARHYLLFATLALVTYFSHGLLNNFLDSDKASVPVFGAMAIIVAIDIMSGKRIDKLQHQNS